MKIFMPLLLIALSHPAIACEYIDGYWHSDKTKSEAYNNTIYKIPPPTIALFLQTFGVQEVIYGGNTMHFLASPSVDTELQGIVVPFDFPEAILNYEVITCSPHKVVLDVSDNEGVAVEGNITIYFESTDVYWTSPLAPWREYFVRKP
jgi:hypothetical protein